ncbi:hypothetical protein F0562_031229 [Nyssa sinensis]|uniref:Fe2OG dioxygenase domain-containing protein n=1 Tax=Nyssa sinensis TaxID=561372 RepID=A0A5J5AVD5_9ASTE|nr:hypothetical protein F0562_031229 [Nyssa sinensis]
MSKLSKIIVELVLMCLGDDFERKFESEFSNCHGYLRIINYSPPECVKEKEVEGLGMHTDMSCVTIVYQDEIGGLQVRSKEGKWMDINPCEDTLVVNIGDLMQAWSNGKLRSSEHRVVLKRHINRFSLAFFWCFEDDKVIFAPDEVVGEKNLRIYKPFVCADYLKFRESNEKGKFEKVGEILKEYGNQMTKLSKRIVEIVLMCLKDDFERKFESEFSNCHGYLRINNYTPPECVKDKEVEGLGMHTDMSCVTIVYQEEIGGLQVRLKGRKVAGHKSM